MSELYCVLLARVETEYRVCAADGKYLSSAQTSHLHSACTVFCISHWAHHWFFPPHLLFLFCFYISKHMCKLANHVHLAFQARNGELSLDHSSLYISHTQSFTSHISAVYPPLCIFAATNLVQVTTIWMTTLAVKWSLMVSTSSSPVMPHLSSNGCICL